MTGEKTEPAYLEPTWSDRGRFALAMAALFGWMYSHKWWFFDLATGLDDCDACATLGTLQFLVVYTLVATSLPPAFLAWKAWRIYRAGQYPSPGAWIIFRTRVRTGWLARLDAFGFLGAAGFFALAPLIVWRELDPLALFFNHGC